MSTNTAVFRLQRDVKEVMQRYGFNSANPPIFVTTAEHSLDHVYALVVGPPDTPYAGGLFLFEVRCTAEYPNAPPQVRIVSTGYGSVRFNPNLYSSGRVCLSILGTWQGESGGSESWRSSYSLGYVLECIQCLIMNAEPYYNEPGFDKEAVSAVTSTGFCPGHGFGLAVAGQPFPSVADPAGNQAEAVDVDGGDSAAAAAPAGNTGPLAPDDDATTAAVAPSLGSNDVGGGESPQPHGGLTPPTVHGGDSPQPAASVADDDIDALEPSQTAQSLPSPSKSPARDGGTSPPQPNDEIAAVTPPKAAGPTSGSPLPPSDAPSPNGGTAPASPTMPNAPLGGGDSAPVSGQGSPSGSMFASSQQAPGLLSGAEDSGPSPSSPGASTFPAPNADPTAQAKKGTAASPGIARPRRVQIDSATARCVKAAVAAAAEAYAIKVQHETIRVTVCDALEAVLHMSRPTPPDQAPVAETVMVTPLTALPAAAVFEGTLKRLFRMHYTEYLRAVESPPARPLHAALAREFPGQAPAVARANGGGLAAALSAEAVKGEPYPDGSHFDLMPFEGSTNCARGTFQYAWLATRLKAIRAALDAETQQWASTGAEETAKPSRIASDLLAAADSVDYDGTASGGPSSSSNAFEWTVTLMPTEGTYADSAYVVDVTFHPQMAEPPRAKFRQPIWHPNVTPDGIPFDCRDEAARVARSSSSSLRYHPQDTMRALSALLTEPPSSNPAAVLNRDAAADAFSNDAEKKKQYRRKARQLAQRTVDA